MKWEDTTSYSQGEKQRGVKPTCFSLEFPVGELTVRMSRYEDEGWVWSLKIPGHFLVQDRNLPGILWTTDAHLEAKRLGLEEFYLFCTQKEYAYHCTHKLLKEFNDDS